MHPTLSRTGPSARPDAPRKTRTRTSRLSDGRAVSPRPPQRRAAIPRFLAKKMRRAGGADGPVRGKAPAAVSARPPYRSERLQSTTLAPCAVGRAGVPARNNVLYKKAERPFIESQTAHPNRATFHFAGGDARAPDFAPHTIRAQRDRPAGDLTGDRRLSTCDASFQT